MLTQLIIKNFGLIDCSALSFHPRLNVLTGETGAGKSIIIDGLRLALGERLRSSQIRDENAPCSVEAVFELNDRLIKQSEVFKEYVSPEDYLLIIQREANADGRSKIKVNGQNVTVAQLKVLGNHLMDFHGPHDHQMLLSEDYHLEMLDRLVDFGDLKEKYENDFKNYVVLTIQLNELQSLALNREREMDLLGHQMKELEQVPLEQGYYDELKQQEARMNNTERLVEAASSLLQLLDHEESGISENIRKAFTFANVLRQTDDSTDRFEDALSHIQENADQLISDLREYLDELSFEPGQADEMKRKIDCYENVKKKYGPSLEDARLFYEKIRQRYQMVLDFEHNDADLKQQIADSEIKLKKAAVKISGLRKTAAKMLEATIEQELKDLGIDHVAFEVRFAETAFSKEGIDKVVFYISPNAGEELKPLAEIVSSGEAARLMLALKKALTQVDPIPVLVFDEIDAQIGGRLGTITGKKLKELSADRQVLLITHLPQIAVFGDKHFRVNKFVKNERTFTDVCELTGDDRIHELAQMMGGKKKSALTIEHAREMVKNAH
jgi:DNA repair protein RecN (Recombination protein N)